MLHAFEIGMLDEANYNEFRLHLLNCPYCFERAQKLESFAEILRTDNDLKKIPDRVIEEQTRPEAAVSGKKTPRFLPGFWPKFVPASVVAAAIIIFLILKPWHIEFQSGREAIAAENRLAVMYFDNLAEPNDPQKLGEITASLLIADLSESGYLQVVSSQRLYDILKLLGKSEIDITNKDMATQIAEKAGAKWTLTGSILQVDPQLIITTQITEVSSGNLIASQRITGADGENLFNLVDRLTVRVKIDLSLPAAAQKEMDRRVADVTTHSPLAYRFYLEGVINYQRFYNTEAVESFKKALAIDSSFAMIYYYLSLTDDVNMIAKAVEYSDRATRKEKHFILSREAFLLEDYDQAINKLQKVLEIYPDNKEAHYRMGVCYGMLLEFEEAIRCYKKAVAIDPLYKIVYNHMAYTYDWMGNLDEAIQAIDMYISLAPEEPNPYDSRGDIYTRNGKLELAIESYAKALEIKPDFWTSLYKFGNNHLFLMQFAIADSCYRELAACDNRLWRLRGKAALAYIPLHQGRFNEAIRLLDEGIAECKLDPDGREFALFHYLKAVAHEEKNNFDLALEEIKESIRINRQQFPDNQTYNQHLLAQLLAQSGDIEAAEKVTEELRKNLISERDTLRHSYAIASIEYAKANLENAIADFEKAAEDTVIPYTPANFMLAVTYIETSRWPDAVAEFERILNKDFTETRLYYGSWTAMVHYYLGLAREELGNIDLAIKQYQIFLDLWKNADPGFMEIGDARKRIGRLNRKGL